MEIKRNNPCDFVEFVRKRNRAIPYCNYGSYRNIFFGIDRKVLVKIGKGAHPCPFLWNCPHEGESFPAPPEKPENV